MINDRRRTHRHRYSGLAKIQAHAGALPRDCWVSDISDGGVRLHCEQVDVPTEFLLLLGNGRPRECRVVWRLGYEVGAEFLDRPEMDYARRRAGR
jgi:hypothetical protein